MRANQDLHEHVGEYRIGKRLGAGGMGVVYEATRADGGVVALKVMTPSANDDYRERRFRDEVMAGSIVKHPNVVRVLDHGETDDGLPYLVMPRVRGENLSRRIRRCDVTIAESLDLGCQLLRALQAMHDAGIVHGDVKSENVLVEKQPDGSSTLVLVDLGLARVWLDDSDPQQLDMVSGTPDYMAPEVVLGSVSSPASDIYAASVLLYEMITGSTPFGGGSAADILVRHLAEVAVPPSLRVPEAGVAAALDEVIMRGLAKHPRERHPSAAAYAGTLAALMVGISRTTTRRKSVRCATEAPTRMAVGARSMRRRMARGTPSHIATSDVASGKSETVARAGLA